MEYVSGGGLVTFVFLFAYGLGYVFGYNHGKQA